MVTGWKQAAIYGTSRETDRPRAVNRATAKKDSKNPVSNVGKGGEITVPTVIAGQVSL